MRVKFKSVFSYLCMIPAILLICTVFIVDNSIPQGIVVGQAFWFYKIMGFMSIAILISYLINKKQIEFSLIDFMFFSFILSGIGITWLIVEELTPRIIMLFYILILYFLFKILLYQKRNTFYFLMISFIVTGLVEAVWGLKQLYGFEYSQHSLFKTTGSFYNPGPYAGYLAMIAPITLHFCLKYWNYINEKMQLQYWRKYCVFALSAITLTCILIILPSTGSRAAWLAVVIGFLVVIILDQQHIVVWMKNNIQKTIACFFVGSILVGFVFYGLYAFKKNSADGRFFIWENTIELIKDNPTGVGVGFYSGNYGRYQAEYFKTEHGTDAEKMIAGSPEYAFNEYLQICAEFGVIPFFLFIVIIASVIVFAIRNSRIAPLGGLVSLLVFAGMSYPFSLVPFIISFILLLTLCTYPTADNAENNKGKTIPILVLLVIICAVCATIYLAVQKEQVYSAYQSWGNSRYLYHVKSYTSAEKIYTEGYNSLKNNVDYLFEYGQILSNLGEYNISNAILKRATTMSCDPMLYNVIGKNYQTLEEYNKAAEYYTVSMNMVPHRLYPYYLLTQMYIENKDIPQAQEMAGKLLSIDIKIPSPATRQIRDEMQSFLDSVEIKKN